MARGGRSGKRWKGPKAAEDQEAALRKTRTKALVRHARAVDAIFDIQDRGGKASPAQLKDLQQARKVFEAVRPYGSHDAEAAYKKNLELVREAAGGQVNRAIRALQLETELRVDPSRRAERFVERWQGLDQASQRQYQAGDMSGYKTTRSAMGDMARSLERDPQLESILANRKIELGIAFETGRRLGQELAFSHGIDLGRGRGIGIDPSIYRRHFPTVRRRVKSSCVLEMLALSCLSSRHQRGSATMLQPNRIIRLRTVLSRTGLSQSTIYRKIAEGTFPAQLKISTKGTGWHESDISRWIAIRSDGVRKMSSMKFGEVGDRIPRPPASNAKLEENN